jgi:hypothetical protein
MSRKLKSHSKSKKKGVPGLYPAPTPAPATAHSSAADADIPYSRTVAAPAGQAATRRAEREAKRELGEVKQQPALPEKINLQRDKSGNAPADASKRRSSGVGVSAAPHRCLIASRVCVVQMKKRRSRQTSNGSTKPVQSGAKSVHKGGPAYPGPGTGTGGAVPLPKLLSTKWGSLGRRVPYDKLLKMYQPYLEESACRLICHDTRCLHSYTHMLAHTQSMHVTVV